MLDLRGGNAEYLLWVRTQESPSRSHSGGHTQTGITASQTDPRLQIWPLSHNSPGPTTDSMKPGCFKTLLWSWRPTGVFVICELFCLSQITNQLPSPAVLRNIFLHVALTVEHIGIIHWHMRNRNHTLLDFRKLLPIQLKSCLGARKTAKMLKLEVLQRSSLPILITIITRKLELVLPNTKRENFFFLKKNWIGKNSFSRFISDVKK